MTEEKQHELKAVYSKWPTNRLVHAATIERNDYGAEAIVLMHAELTERGIAVADLPEISSRLSRPTTPGEVKTGTFFRPTTLGRKKYAIRWLVWVLTFLVGSASLELAPSLRSVSFPIWFILFISYKIIYLDIPRIRNAGASPLFLLLLLIPLVNLGLLIFLFAAPPRKNSS